MTNATLLPMHEHKQAACRKSVTVFQHVECRLYSKPAQAAAALSPFVCPCTYAHANALDAMHGGRHVQHFSQPLQSQGLEHLDVLANGVVVLAGYQAPDQEYFRHQRLAARGRSDIDQVGASVATLQSCSLPWVHLLNACLGICLHACSSRSFAVSTHLSCAWVEHKLQPIHQLEMRQLSVQI